MSDNIASILHLLPWWIWVCIPVLIIGALTYWRTRDKHTTMVITGTALAAVWSVAALHFWEQYLANHFFGEFDQYGLPTKMSPAGWALMWHALPLWLIPAALFSGLVFLITYLIKNRKIQNLIEQLRHPEKKPAGSSAPAAMMGKLHFHDLQHQIAKKKAMLQKAESRRADTERSLEEYEDLLAEQYRENKTKNREIEFLNNKIDEQAGNLERAQALIELLRREIEKGEQLEEE
jgi:hypothetical protein